MAICSVHMANFSLQMAPTWLLVMGKALQYRPCEKKKAMDRVPWAGGMRQTCTKDPMDGTRL